MSNCVFCGEDKVAPVYVAQKWRVFIADEPAYPGFCRVVLNGHVAEMTDLTDSERTQLMNVVWLVEKAVRQVMAPDKVNLASLGNMVPHVHWHVIPRYADDRSFPDSVWSAARREPDAGKMAQRAARLPELARVLKGMLTELYGPSLK